MWINSYEEQLTGGHPNSLGNTVVVVENVLTDKAKLRHLFDCYKSKDAVVRLRVSSAVKRVCKVHPEWVAKYLDELLDEISKIDQASTKWTLSILFVLLDPHMSEKQRLSAIQIMKENLHYHDWIVQNTTAESLAYFAEKSAEVKNWLLPELQKLTKSVYKSLARRCERLLVRLQ